MGGALYSFPSGSKQLKFTIRQCWGSDVQSGPHWAVVAGPPSRWAPGRSGPLPSPASQPPRLPTILSTWLLPLPQSRQCGVSLSHTAFSLAFSPQPLPPFRAPGRTPGPPGPSGIIPLPQSVGYQPSFHLQPDTPSQVTSRWQDRGEEVASIRGPSSCLPWPPFGFLSEVL